MTITEFPAFTQSKNNAVSDVKTSGNVSTDNAVQMTISAEGTAHIMSMLTDLYSSPELAVLREYSSNALDSHKEAGQTAPILVTLPTTWNPVFTVQDFGVGMSAQDIKTIYSAYGASTKQKDFNQVGAFGLGCKSALSLTQQFTLVSIKDGRKSVVLIARGDNGVGTVNVISEADTDEPNGVTVSVPIEKVQTFNDKVKDFFLTWEPGSVLVDSEQPASIYSGEYSMSKDKNVLLCTIKDRYAPNSVTAGFHIIMGGISYYVNLSDVIDFYDSNTPDVYSSIKSFLAWSAAVFVTVPIGSVDLTPSREGLRYSDRTVEFLKSLYDYTIGEMASILSDSLKECTSRADVVDLCWSYQKLFDAFHGKNNKDHSITWNGEVIPSNVIFDTIQARLALNRLFNSNSDRMYQRAKSHKISTIDIDNADQYFIVESDSERAAKVSRDLYLFAEAEEMQLQYKNIYLLDHEPDSLWITDNTKFIRLDPDVIMDSAKEMRKKIRNESGSKRKIKFTYWVLKFSKDSAGVEDTVWEKMDVDDIKKDALFHVKGSFPAMDSFLSYPRATSTTPADLTNTLSAIGMNDGDMIVGLTQGQTYDALIKRMKVTALKTTTDLRKESRDKFLSTIPKEVALYLTVSSGHYYESSNILTNINSIFCNGWVPDNADNKLFKIYEEYSASASFKKDFEYFTSMGVGSTSFSQIDVNNLVTKISNASKEYPLLHLDSSYYGRPSATRSAYHDYVNMVDTYERKV